MKVLRQQYSLPPDLQTAYLKSEVAKHMPLCAGSPMTSLELSLNRQHEQLWVTLVAVAKSNNYPMHRFIPIACRSSTKLLILKPQPLNVRSLKAFHMQTP